MCVIFLALRYKQICCDRHLFHPLRAAHARPVGAEATADHERVRGYTILTQDLISNHDPPKVNRTFGTHKCCNDDFKTLYEILPIKIVDNRL